MNEEDGKMWLTTGDVAKQLGVSIPTVSTYILKGYIKPDRVMPSKRKLFKQETVNAFLNKLMYEEGSIEE